jgi:hypothetical protein
LRLHERDSKIADMFRAADAAHVRWQTDGAGFWACCDQFVHGQVRGSRYYPRIITAALWMDETAAGVEKVPEEDEAPIAGES